MKAVGSSFAVNFRPLVVGLLRRTFASGVKPSAATSLDNVKPHARSGILSAVDKDDSGFPSYLILKETSPVLRSVSRRGFSGRSFCFALLRALRTTLRPRQCAGRPRSNGPGRHCTRFNVLHYFTCTGTGE